MCCFRDTHGMNSYKAGCVCIAVRLSEMLHLDNIWMNFDEILYAITGSPKLVRFNFVHSLTSAWLTHKPVRWEPRNVRLCNVVCYYCYAYRHSFSLTFMAIKWRNSKYLVSGLIAMINKKLELELEIWYRDRAYICLKICIKWSKIII
jgi:hypothetical protein